MGRFVVARGSVAVSQDRAVVGAPRSLRGLLERERLFAAVLAEAGACGYRQTSVVTVCARAGLSEACFYAHFGSTEECLLEALHALAMRAHAQGLLCAAGGPEDESLTDRIVDRLSDRDPNPGRDAGRDSDRRHEHEPGCESAAELAEERLGRVLDCLAPILAATVL